MRTVSVTWPVVGSVTVELTVPDDATDEEILAASADLVTDEDAELEWETVREVQTGVVNHHPHNRVTIDSEEV